MYNEAENEVPMKLNDKALIRLWWIVLILYFTALAYVVFWTGERQSTFGEVNLIPLRTIRMFITGTFVDQSFTFGQFLLNIGGNIVIFLPLGFLIPLCLHRKMNLFAILGIALFLSAVIELVQYLSVLGEADVDDVLLNICGAAVGYTIERGIIHEA